jgi:hypothetical protein
MRRLRRDLGQLQNVLFRLRFGRGFRYGGHDRRGRRLRCGLGLRLGFMFSFGLRRSGVRRGVILGNNPADGGQDFLHGRFLRGLL